MPEPGSSFVILFGVGQWDKTVLSELRKKKRLNQTT